jgi:hypothetical protein
MVSDETFTNGHQVRIPAEVFRLSTRRVDKSVDKPLRGAVQGAWERACRRLGETLTNLKYGFRTDSCDRPAGTVHARFAFCATRAAEAAGCAQRT